MKLSILNYRAFFLAGLLAIGLAALWLNPRAGAQDKDFPSRSGHINDLAEVIDPGMKTRLEGVLENLKQRSDLDFVVVTVKTTAGEDLYEYSLRLARNWKIGEPTGRGKSLLVVIAGDNGKLFSQVTPAARIYLPEGLIGDMGRRMRDSIDRSGFSSGVLAGVQTFIDRAGELHSFTFAALDTQTGDTAVAQRQRPRTVSRPNPETEPSPNPQPTPTATEIAQVAVTPPPAVETSSPAPSGSPTAPVRQPSESPSPVEIAKTKPAESPIESPPAQASPSETPVPANPVKSPTPEASPSETLVPTTTPAPKSTLFETPAAQTSPSESPAPVEAPAQSSPAATQPRKQIASNSARPNRTTDRKAPAEPVDPEDELEEVELTLTKPLAERIDLLKAFISSHPTSVAKPRAHELLAMARALLGDQKMQAQNTEAGLQLFRQAVSEAPADMPDRLFSDVLARIPLNLFLRGQREAAFQAARQLETLANGNGKRLLLVAQFYVSIENADEAGRLAEAALKVMPDSAAAHQALGAARHLALRLDEAEAEYARAVALDPKSGSARVALADLKRASGKYEEALALYREQLAIYYEKLAADPKHIDPASMPARAGMVLSLLELGKKDEAETELNSALQDRDKPNLALLAGAAYWYLAHNNKTHGMDLARKAVTLEPRYSWGEIVLARALIANGRPLPAERALRYVRQFSRFPTLDYEVASVLMSVGLYDEAFKEISQSFRLTNGDLETKLAGTVTTRAAGFNELLSLERRAAIFQSNGIESDANAQLMKALMIFNSALNKPSPNEDELLPAIQEFTKGDDAMRTYRQVYVASKLLKKGILLPTVVALMDKATEGVEAAVDVPAATVAAQAEELADARDRAIAQGSTLDVPDAPRMAISGILRGRIEDIAGLAFFNMDKYPDAVTRLRRAVATATEGTPVWRSSLWHLGAALEADGKNDQALLFYIKSYVNGQPDVARRSVIENIYKKVNGTLDGLDDKIGPGFAASTANPDATPSPSPTP